MNISDRYDCPECKQYYQAPSRPLDKTCSTCGLVHNRYYWLNKDLLSSMDVGELFDAIHNDKDIGTRLNAIEQCARFSDPRVIPGLIALLGTPDFIFCASKSLGKIGIPSTAPLIAALDDPELGEGAACALGQVGDEFAVKPLSEILLNSKKAPSFRLAAARALSEISGSSIVEPLIIALAEDEDAEVRADCAHSLGFCENPIVLYPLISALKDPDPDVRVSAVRSLSEIRDQSAVEPLIETLNDDNAKVRETAAWHLSEFVDRSAVGPLIALLKDENADVRNSAASSLEALPDLRSVEPLIDSLEDSYSSVRQYAISALGDIGDPRACGPLIRVLQFDEDFHSRRDSAEALGKLKCPIAVDPLICALKDPEAEVRLAAIKALNTFRDSRAVVPIISLLQDEDNKIRKASAFALSRHRDTRSVEPLIGVLEGDPSRYVRSVAAYSLLILRDPRARESLMKARNENLPPFGFIESGRVIGYAEIPLGDVFSGESISE